jgi:hypothetical protein
MSGDDYSGVKADGSGLESLAKGVTAFGLALTFAIFFIVGIFVYMMVTGFDI